jgi:hypothetical protein
MREMEWGDVGDVKFSQDETGHSQAHIDEEVKASSDHVLARINGPWMGCMWWRRVVPGKGRWNQTRRCLAWCEHGQSYKKA